MSLTPLLPSPPPPYVAETAAGRTGMSHKPLPSHPRNVREASSGAKQSIVPAHFDTKSRFLLASFLESMARHQPPELGSLRAQTVTPPPHEKVASWALQIHALADPNPPPIQRVTTPPNLDAPLPPPPKSQYEHIPSPTTHTIRTTAHQTSSSARAAQLDKEVYGSSGRNRPGDIAAGVPSPFLGEAELEQDKTHPLPRTPLEVRVQPPSDERSQPTARPTGPHQTAHSSPSMPISPRRPHDVPLPASDPTISSPPTVHPTLQHPTGATLPNSYNAENQQPPASRPQVNSTIETRMMSSHPSAPNVQTAAAPASERTAGHGRRPSHDTLLSHPHTFGSRPAHERSERSLPMSPRSVKSAKSTTFTAERHHVEDDKDLRELLKGATDPKLDMAVRNALKTAAKVRIETLKREDEERMRLAREARSLQSVQEDRVPKWAMALQHLLELTHERLDFLDRQRPPSGSDIDLYQSDGAVRYPPIPMTPTQGLPHFPTVPTTPHVQRFTPYDSPTPHIPPAQQHQREQAFESTPTAQQYDPSLGARDFATPRDQGREMNMPEPQHMSMGGEPMQRQFASWGGAPATCGMPPESPPWASAGPGQFHYQTQIHQPQPQAPAFPVPSVAHTQTPGLGSGPSFPAPPTHQPYSAAGSPTPGGAQAESSINVPSFPPPPPRDAVGAGAGAPPPQPPLSPGPSQALPTTAAPVVRSPTASGLQPWERVRERLDQWAAIWENNKNDQVQQALESTHHGQQVTLVAMDIFCAQVYKRWIRTIMGRYPPVHPDKLFIPPSFSDVLNGAVFADPFADTATTFREFWYGLGFTGSPRLVVALALYRTDRHHLQVLKFDLQHGILIRYDPYDEPALPDKRPMLWWPGLRATFPDAGIPPTEALVEHVVPLRRAKPKRHDNALAALAVWRHLLVDKRVDKETDLKAVRTLVAAEVEGLLHKVDRKRRKAGGAAPRSAQLREPGVEI